MRSARGYFVCLIVSLALAAGLASSLAGQGKADALAEYQAGRDLETRGNSQAAQTHYLEAIAICDSEILQNERHIDSYVVKCWSQLRLKQYKETLDTGVRALNVSEDLRVIESMGEAYFYYGNNFQACLKSMQTFVDKAQDKGYVDRIPTAYFFMGEVYRNWARPGLAELAYTAAIMYLGENSTGIPTIWWFQLGRMREQLSDWAGAQKAYLKAYPGRSYLAQKDKEALDAGIANAQARLSAGQ